MAPPFADIGSHWCDLVEFVTGQRIVRPMARPATVDPARSSTVTGPSFARGKPAGPKVAVDTEDIALVLFEMDGGAVGSLTVSQVSSGAAQPPLVRGGWPAGRGGFRPGESRNAVGGRARVLHPGPRGLPAAAADARRLDRIPTGHPQGCLGYFDAFVYDAYWAIGGTAPDGLPRFSDGRRGVELTAAVLASARSGAWQKVQ